MIQGLPNLLQSWSLNVSDMVANLNGGLVNTGVTTSNLFKIVSPTHIDDTVWPAKSLVEEPVYAFAPRGTTSQRFMMVSDQSLDQILNKCESQVSFGDQQQSAGDSRYVLEVKCVVGKQEVTTACGDFQPCRYDYGLLYMRQIAEDTKSAYGTFEESKVSAVQHCKFSPTLRPPYYCP